MAARQPPLLPSPPFLPPLPLLPRRPSSPLPSLLFPFLFSFFCGYQPPTGRQHWQQQPAATTSSPARSSDELPAATAIPASSWDQQQLAAVESCQATGERQQRPTWTAAAHQQPEHQQAMTGSPAPPSPFSSSPSVSSSLLRPVVAANFDKIFKD
nr:uncharacterized protein LOC104647877 [Solanum lycopersicum]